MADKSKSKIEEHDVGVVPAVTSTTEATPSKADESPQPGPYTGAGKPELNDPPVRAASPDVAIAQTLVAGAGEHTPPDPKVIDESGRAIYDERAASEAGEGETVKADDVK